MVVILISGFVGAAATYQARLMRRARELALRADLQCLRAGVVFFQATRGRAPATLEEVLVEPIGRVKRGERSVAWSLQDQGQRQADPFGHPYRYEPGTGVVASTTAGYESW